MNEFLSTNEYRPIVALPQDVVNAFTAAATTAFLELIQVVAAADPDLHNGVAMTRGPFVSASLTLLRSTPGTMSLVLTEESALRLAAHYLPEGTALNQEMVDDVAGEFANVIAGQAKTMLKGTEHHYTISTPVVKRADRVNELPNVAAGSSVISLHSELGRVLLFVRLP